MKKITLLTSLIILSLSVNSYGQELGPMGKRARTLLKLNPTLSSYCELSPCKVIPDPTRLDFRMQMADYRATYPENITNNQSDELQNNIKEDVIEDLAILEKEVSPTAPYITESETYSNATCNYEYTPEQLEQIKASEQAYKDNLLNTENSNLEIEKEHLPIYTKVKRASMNVLNEQNIPEEQTAAYTDYDSSELVPGVTSPVVAADKIQEISPEFCVYPNIDVSRSVEEENEFVSQKMTERHDGNAWRKIYYEEDAQKENFAVNEASSDAYKAISESQKLRKQFKDVFRKTDIVNDGKAEIYSVREDKSLDDAGLNYPDNTMLVEYTPNDVIDVVIAANKTTDIRLKEYEKVTDITVGSQDGLIIEGYKDSRKQHSHITIKPYEDDIKTVLRVTTNFSKYQFQLVSGTPETYNPFVLFKLSNDSHMPFNPQIGERLGAATLRRTRHERKPIEVQEPDELNFNFTTKGKKYLPKYIWDDGRFTYVLLPKSAYNHEIYILGFVGDKAQQIREYEIQDDFMKIYGTWSKLRFKIDNQDLDIVNNEYIPEH